MNFDIPRLIYRKEEIKQIALAQGNYAGRTAKKAHIRTRCGEAQGWRCAYCARVMTLEPGKGSSITLEHVIPQSKGGRDKYSHCVAVCSGCNQKRGDKPLSQFAKERGLSWAKELDESFSFI